MRNEHPIIMSGESVPTIMAGRKTQTRRLVNLETLAVFVPRNVMGEAPTMKPLLMRGRYRVKLNPYGAVFAMPGDIGLKPGEFDFRCHYLRGQTTLDGNGWLITPNSRQYLRVREDFRIIHERAGGSNGAPLVAANIPKDDDGGYWRPEYRCDTHRTDGIRWHRGTYMPNWAVRLRPEVLRVRLERLHDITEDGAQAEGVRPFFEQYPKFGRDQRITSGELARDAPYRASFAVRWDELNGDRALWITNPWVWAITMGEPKESDHG